MAIAFDVTAFKLRYTEFSSLSSGSIEAVADDARLYVSEGVFGVKAEHALRLYTAHLLTIQARGGSAGGPVVMEKVGDLTTQYAAPMMNANNMDATTYGTQFAKLARQRTGTGAFHVNL